MRRIYLDNAATSWPKPEAVYRAVDRFQREVGASYGRGGYDSARATAEVVDGARRGVATLLGEQDPSRVVFCNSGTDALAIAIHGLVREGDHVVTSVLEHNAVLRPLHALGAQTTFVGVDRHGRVSPEEVAAQARDDTRMIILSHASNVTGVVQPVGEIARLVRDSPARLLVDAAQTVGRWPLDVTRLGADLVAAPGHKGLYGPLGTGLLWIRPGLAEAPAPLRYGGTGSVSEAPTMPSAIPERYEAGSLNAPGIAGLGAGVAHVLEEGVAELRRAVTETTRRLRELLSEIDGLRLYGGDSEGPNAGVVAFNVRGYDPQEVAAGLAAVAGVECRAGLHCSPLAHSALGTSPVGCVRFSPGATTTPAEVRIATDAVAELAASPPS